MAPLVSIVDLSSGLVSECGQDALTLDVPTSLAADVSVVALDAAGRLHFDGGPSPSAAVEASHPRPVSDRRLGDACFVQFAPDDRDAHGWQVYHLCVREP